MCESTDLSYMLEKDDTFNMFFKCNVRFNNIEIIALIEIALLKLFPRCTFKGTFDITEL